MPSLTAWMYNNYFLLTNTSLKHNLILNITQPFDGHAHHIILLQIHIRFTDKTNSFRSAREDNRALLQRRAFGQERNDISNAPNHIGRI